MTAFVPIPAREAAELVEAAGIPHARRLLIDSAAAGLVDAYAQAIGTAQTAGPFKTVRGPAIPIALWHRMVKQGHTDDIWTGGAVRLPGSDLIGGTPEVHVTGVGFGEASLQRLIASHVRGPAATNCLKVPGSPTPATVGQPAAPVSVLGARAPLPAGKRQPAQRSADMSAIPAGAITVTVKVAEAATGLGHTTIYKLIDDGRLERVKVGGRTLITVESIRRLVGSPSATLETKP